MKTFREYRVIDGAGKSEIVKMSPAMAAQKRDDGLLVIPIRK